jgi:hypothetical protein
MSPLPDGGGFTPSYIADNNWFTMEYLRTQVGDDLLGYPTPPAEDSPERYILNGACLSEDVFSDEKYNKNMDMDFLQIFFLMQSKIQHQL